MNVGDMNGDGGWNVLDIVLLANCVLADSCGSENSINDPINYPCEFDSCAVAI